MFELRGVEFSHFAEGMTTRKNKHRRTHFWGCDTGERPETHIAGRRAKVVQHREKCDWSAENEIKGCGLESVRVKAKETMVAFRRLGSSDCNAGHVQPTALGIVDGPGK